MCEHQSRDPEVQELAHRIAESMWKSAPRPEDGNILKRFGGSLRRGVSKVFHRIEGSYVDWPFWERQMRAWALNGVASIDWETEVQRIGCHGFPPSRKELARRLPIRFVQELGVPNRSSHFRTDLLERLSRSSKRRGVVYRGSRKGREVAVALAMGLGSGGVGYGIAQLADAAQRLSSEIAAGGTVAGAVAIYIGDRRRRRLSDDQARVREFVRSWVADLLYVLTGEDWADDDPAELWVGYKAAQEAQSERWDAPSSSGLKGGEVATESHEIARLHGQLREQLLPAARAANDKTLTDALARMDNALMRLDPGLNSPDRLARLRVGAFFALESLIAVIDFCLPAERG